VAAGKDQAQAIVREFSHLFFIRASGECGKGGVGLDLGALSLECLAPTEAVDGFSSRRGRDPGTGVAWDAIAWPALDRDGEGVLKRVLREVKVAAGADKSREDAAGLFAEDTLNAICRAAH